MGFDEGSPSRKLIMDLSTIVGTILVTAFLVWSMMLGNGGLILFYDMPSIVMVCGGSVAVVMMNYTFADLKSLFSVVMRAFISKSMAPTELIERTVEYSNLARKEGILALEAKLKEVKDPFFAKGLQGVVDGFSADTVRSIMELDADWSRARHANGKKVLETFAAMAPAFGMIGTLVGLVQMLASLSDPSQIGGGMAVALLTTFYGAVIANVMCIPIAGKLDLRAKEEAQLKAMMIDGVLAIQSGEKPTIIRERLSAFLAPKLRERAAA